MKTTKVITVETETLMIIRRAKVARGWCPDCHAEVDTTTLGESDLANPSTTANVQRWLASGKVHVLQPATGPVQICLASLLRCLESAEVQKTCVGTSNLLNQTRRKQ